MNDELKKVVNHTFFTLHGCIVERTNEGFKVLKQEVKTIEEAEAVIAESIQSLQKSIK